MIISHNLLNKDTLIHNIPFFVSPLAQRWTFVATPSHILQRVKSTFEYRLVVRETKHISPWSFTVIF